MMIVFAAVHIEIDGNRRLADVELVTSKVEMAIRSKIPCIKKISVIPHSSINVLADAIRTNVDIRDKHTFVLLKIRISIHPPFHGKMHHIT